MNIWEILGIQATSDVDTIKRAYAEKAKECHSEENPEGYQILRKAYKAAIKSAKVSGKKEQEQAAEKEEEKTEEKAENLFGESSQGEVLCQDEGLDFKEVEKSLLREAYDQFLQEFRYISFNPCLRNNFFCWRHFFSKEEYQSLFLNEDFRQEFVHTVSEGLFWDKETLDFFDRRLEDLSGGMASGQSVREQVRRRHRLKKLLLGSGDGEMGEIHRTIMRQVEATGIPTDGRAQNRKEAESYLQFYLTYAAEHEEEIRQWHRDKCNALLRRNVGLILFLTVLFIVLCLLTLI